MGYPTHLAILGVGLVGGSLARAAMEAGVPRVVVYDADPQVRARAKDLRLGHEVAEHVEDAVRGAELVVAAVPAAAVPGVLATAARVAPPDAILTDVASLKSHVTVEVESRLRLEGADPARFVGGHPMAGSERSGPDAADAELFQAATWVLTPTEATADDAIQRLTAFLRRLGCRVLALPPGRHDELVAIVSHLPQVVASALADVAADAVESAGDAVLAVSGGGFRDTTRIAASDPELWVGILGGNRDAVLDALDAYRGRLDELRAAVADADDGRLGAILGRASAARRRLVPKAQQIDLVDLVVPLADRPGALATATTALGEAGVNIEDLAMRHAADGRRGVLLVRVESRVTARAIRVLAARGLRAHVEKGSDDTAGGSAPTS